MDIFQCLCVAAMIVGVIGFIASLWGIGLGFLARLSLRTACFACQQIRRARREHKNKTKKEQVKS